MKNFFDPNQFWLNSKLFIVIFWLIFFSGCSFYASDEEIKNLENFKKEVFTLEEEVKNLKLRQLELFKEKSELTKKLNECQKLRDSLANAGKN
ncbi:MAG: hypothetical protein WHV63_01280 [Ignavibacteria bacterium]